MAESPRSFSPKKSVGARVQIREGRFFENFTEGDEGQIIGLDGDVAIVRFDKQGEHRVSRRHLKVRDGSTFRSLSPSDDLRREVLFWNQTVDAGSFLMNRSSPKSGSRQHGPVQQMHQNLQSPSAIRHTQRSSRDMVDKIAYGRGASFTPTSLFKPDSEGNGMGMSPWSRGRSRDVVLHALADEKMDEQIYSSKLSLPIKQHEEVRAKATHGTATGGGARQQQPQQLQQQSRHDRYSAASETRALDSHYTAARDTVGSPRGERTKYSTGISHQKQLSVVHERTPASDGALNSHRDNRATNRASVPVSELKQQPSVRRSKELGQAHSQYMTQRSHIASPRAGDGAPLSLPTRASTTERLSQRMPISHGNGVRKERSPQGMSSPHQHDSAATTPPRYQSSASGKELQRKYSLPSQRRQEDDRLTALKSNDTGGPSRRETSPRTNFHSARDTKSRQGGGFSPRSDHPVRKVLSPRNIDHGPTQSSYSSHLGQRNMSPRLEELLNKYNITLLNGDASPRSACLTSPSQAYRRSASPRNDTDGSARQNATNASHHRTQSPKQWPPPIPSFESDTPLDDDRQPSQHEEKRTFATAAQNKSTSGTTDRQPSRREEERTFATTTQHKSISRTTDRQPSQRQEEQTDRKPSRREEGRTDRQPSRREEERMRVSDRHLPPQDKMRLPSGRSPRSQDASVVPSPSSIDRLIPSRAAGPTYFPETQRRSACPTIINKSPTPTSEDQRMNRDLRMTDLFSPHRAAPRDILPHERFVTSQLPKTAQQSAPLEMPILDRMSGPHSAEKSGYVSKAAVSDHDGYAQMQPGSIMRPSADRSRVAASERNGYSPTQQGATMWTSANEEYNSRAVESGRDGVSTTQRRRDETLNGGTTWASANEQNKSRVASGCNGISHSRQEDEGYVSMASRQDRGERQQTIRGMSATHPNEDQTYKIANLEAEVRTMSCLLAQSEARVDKLASAVYTQQANMEPFRAENTADLHMSIIDSRTRSRAEENTTSFVDPDPSFYKEGEPQLLYEDARATKPYFWAPLPPTAATNEYLRHTLPATLPGGLPAASMGGMDDAERHSAPSHYAVVRSSAIKPHWPTARSSRSPSPTQKLDCPPPPCGPGYNGSPQMKLLPSGGNNASPVVAMLPYHTSTVAAQQDEIAASDPNLIGRQHYGAHFRLHAEILDASLPASMNLPLPDLRTPCAPPRVESRVECTNERTTPDPLLARSATFDRHIMAKNAAHRDVVLNSSRKGSLPNLRGNASTTDPVLGPPRLTAASDLVIADGVEPVAVPSTMPSPPPRHRGAIPCESLSPTRRLSRANCARQSEVPGTPASLPASFTLDGPSAYAITYSIGASSNVGEDTSPVSEKVIIAETPTPPWHKYSAFGPTAQQMYNRGTVNPLLAPALVRSEVDVLQTPPTTPKSPRNKLDVTEIRNETLTDKAVEPSSPALSGMDWCDAPLIQRDSVECGEVITGRSSPKVGASWSPKDGISGHQTPSSPTPSSLRLTTQDTAARLKTPQDAGTVPETADGAIIMPKESPGAAVVHKAEPGASTVPKTAITAAAVPKAKPGTTVALKATTDVTVVTSRVGVRTRGLNTHFVGQMHQAHRPSNFSLGMANTAAPSMFQHSVSAGSLPFVATTTPISSKTQPLPTQGTPLDDTPRSGAPLARASSNSSGASTAPGFSWLCCADTRPKYPVEHSAPPPPVQKYATPNSAANASIRSALGTPTFFPSNSMGTPASMIRSNFATRQVSAPQAALSGHASAPSPIALSTGTPQTLRPPTGFGATPATASRWNSVGPIAKPSNVPQCATNNGVAPTMVRASHGGDGMTKYQTVPVSNAGERMQSPVRTLIHAVPAVRGTGALDGSNIFKPDFRLMEEVRPLSTMAQQPYETLSRSPSSYFNISRDSQAINQ
eukprot:GEMP01000416.1.p1 GENE.GEMP01000416.1~~GEMP01000416.1.p1  ORF type:complete len:1908 (+),score=391.01 GEMP01000416.1:109-5832(+)